MRLLARWMEGLVNNVKDESILSHALEVPNKDLYKTLANPCYSSHKRLCVVQVGGIKRSEILCVHEVVPFRRPPKRLRSLKANVASWLPGCLPSQLQYPIPKTPSSHFVLAFFLA